MRKIVFMFPGQGSQEIGMGADLFKDDSCFRKLVELGSDYAHEDLEKLCLKGPDKKLIQARFLQPLLTSVSLGYLRHVRERGIKPDVVCGHSLGEITALAAAGIVTDEQSVVIAAKRGELMDEMASRVNGGMMAVIFVGLEKTEQLLDTVYDPDRIVLANDNAPDQLVLSGDNDMLDTFAEQVTKEQLGKTRRIIVNGPWHSHYMRDARLKFEDWAEHIHFNHPQTPIVLNSLAKTDNHPGTIKHLVTWQLTSPVFWRESMNTLHEMGVDTMLEIGPGRVLSGLARVNGFKKETTIFNVNNLRGLDLAASELTHSAN